MPLISVILPVYNIKGEYLTKAVRSVLAQSFEDFELLIVDDGSRRETAAVCDELAAEDKRIMVFHNVNQGPGKSRNFGLSKAQGAFAIFMDHDDWVEKDWLKKLYESIVRNDADAAFAMPTNMLRKRARFMSWRHRISVLKLSNWTTLFATRWRMCFLRPGPNW
jgi:glycosyltransferase, family 2